jgi:two-component system alkaline phosphatase synthesis response regulator PhoP
VRAFRFQFWDREYSSLNSTSLSFYIERSKAGLSMSKETILIVEDEADLAEVVAYNLEREGYTILRAASGEDGLKLAVNKQPALILLDLMLPGMGGLDVCRLLKSDEKTRRIPVIMMTARSEDVDVVTGLELGADDYVTKPFSPRVLTARVRTALRRRKVQDEEKETIIEAGDLRLDVTRHQANVVGQRIDLTATEFELLVVLARRPGWVFSRSQLIDSLRDGQHVITDRAIDVQIANIRKKLGVVGGLVETVRGVGYRMKGEE